MAKRGKHLLNNLQIKRWIASGEPLARTDGEGLTFTLSKAGTGTWVLRYRFDNVPKELTLGNYPDISLADARALAKKARANVDAGADPAKVKQKEKVDRRLAITVKDLAVDFKTKGLSDLAESTVYYRHWDLDNVIIPRLGKETVVDTRPVDIVHMLETAKRTWTISKRVLTTATKLFDHACGRRIINVNPCAGVNLDSIIGPRPPIRRRVMLTEEELCTLLTGIEDIGYENALAFRILLATCVRSVELAKARWEYMDLVKGNWWVPDENVKTRTGFLVPLTPTVISWFLALKVLSGASEWVLPARRERRNRRHGGDIHVGETTLWAAITRAFDRGDLDVRRFTPHDTRSTAKGHMRNMGISKDITEIALNHTLKGMEGVYDVREEIPERRVALEQWATFLVMCEQKETT